MSKVRAAAKKLASTFGTSPKGKGKATSSVPTRAAEEKSLPVQESAGQTSARADTMHSVDSVGPDTTPVSERATEVAPLPQEGKTMKLIKNAVQSKKGNSKAIAYHVDGIRGSVRISSTLFAGGADNAPDEIDSLDALNGTSRAKLSKEERKAARAAMTPEQKVAEAQKRADAAVARAKKLAASLAGN